MFWIEILQRGRSIASSIGIDPRLASKEMIDGLSMAEWFGFTDKYLKESGELQFPELIPGFDTTAWTREQKISADPRFNKPSGRTVENTFPEIKQILLNTARNIKTTRDPQQINASLTALYRSFGNPTNAPVPNKSNLFRWVFFFDDRNYDFICLFLRFIVDSV